MKKKDGPEWVEVVSTGDDEEAILMAGFLQAEGIPTVVEGPTSTPWPEDLGVLGMSRVMVPPDRADEARRLLESRRHKHGRGAREESEAGEE